MAREIRTDVRIRASQGQVWRVLTDFPSYPSWNPFIREISGTATPGAKLTIRLQGFGRSTTRFRPRVLAAREPQELRWLGRLGIPGLFDGEHSFTMEPTEGGGVVFTQGETFRGVLVPFFWRALEPQTRVMFGRMNHALRSRVEAVAL